MKREPFQYAVLRVVPRVERGECFNAGVVLMCRPRRFLAARTHLDAELLATFAPDLDAAAVQDLLHAAEHIAVGDEQGGPIAELPMSERFHWLVAPSSTVLQPSPVHTGLTEDPALTLERLFTSLVMR